MEVLFEQEEGGYTKGHTTNYMMIKTKEKGMENKIMRVKIVKENKSELIGNEI